MPSRKRSLLRTLLTVHVGCGCGKPDLSGIHEPSPRPKTTVLCKPNPSSRTPSTSTTSGERIGDLSMDDEDLIFTAISEAEAEHKMSATCSKSNTLHQGSKLIGSIAMQKDSDDPYKDFRTSMLQMIFENEISTQSDLLELLGCLLGLNAPSHHEVIRKAFSDICQEAFPKEVQTADHLNQ